MGQISRKSPVPVPLCVYDRGEATVSFWALLSSYIKWADKMTSASLYRKEPFSSFPPKIASVQPYIVGFQLAWLWELLFEILFSITLSRWHMLPFCGSAEEDKISRGRNRVAEWRLGHLRRPPNSPNLHVDEKIHCFSQCFQEFLKFIIPCLQKGSRPQWFGARSDSYYSFRGFPPSL